jgi:hypothetical protein
MIKPDDADVLNNKILAQEKLGKEDNNGDRKIKYYTSDGKPVYE